MTTNYPLVVCEEPLLLIEGIKTLIKKEEDEAAQVRKTILDNLDRSVEITKELDKQEGCQPLIAEIRKVEQDIVALHQKLMERQVAEAQQRDQAQEDTKQLPHEETPPVDQEAPVVDEPVTNELDEGRKKIKKLARWLKHKTHPDRTHNEELKRLFHRVKKAEENEDLKELERLRFIVLQLLQGRKLRFVHEDRLALERKLVECKILTKQMYKELGIFYQSVAGRIVHHFKRGQTWMAIEVYNEWLSEQLEEKLKAKQRLESLIFSDNPS